MSVKWKNTRVITGVKSVGIKSVDEYFKQAITPLAVSIEMREALESALVCLILLRKNNKNALECMNRRKNSIYYLN